MDVKEIEKIIIGSIVANQLLGKPGSYVQFLGEISYRRRGIDRINFKYDKNIVHIEIEFFADKDWNYTDEIREMRSNINNIRTSYSNVNFQNNIMFKNEQYEIRIYDMENLKNVLSELL